jgi:glutamate synthase (NADPH/NADH) small chain
MGKVTGFLEIDRQRAKKYSRRRAIRHFTSSRWVDKDVRDQAARCMDCGIPYLPWPDRLPGQQPDPGLERPRLQRQLGRGLRNLHSTNNFPEFTGRICPAPCEEACTLNLEDNAGHHQDDRMRHRRQGLGEGWMKPEPAVRQDRQEGRRDRLGPGRHGCAQQLARAGHDVHVLSVRPRPAACCATASRLQDGEARHRPARHQMEARASPSITASMSASTPSIAELLNEYDAVLTGGAEKPRDLPIPGRDLDGVHSPWPSCRSRTAASAASRLATSADPRRRQACRRHRRRRHRLRLHRHLAFRQGARR